MTRDPADEARPVAHRHPRRPVLAPGLRVQAGASGDLEIGLSPAHRFRIADSPSVRRVLDLLERGEAPRDSPSTRKVLARLAPVLRDGDSLVHPPLPAGEVAAAVLRHADDATARLRRRGQQRVGIAGDPALAEYLGLGSLLRRSGLPEHLVEGRRAPTVVLVLAHGEPDRAEVDRLLRTGVPHLVVRLIESEVVLGPFVVPGRTACLRCVDAHLAVVDSRRARVLAEYHNAVRHDGVVEPLDTAITTAALGWAVADLVRFAEGDRPTTWSSTLALASGRVEVAALPWLRHPRCGCSWGSQPDRAGTEDGSVTLGA